MGAVIAKKKRGTGNVVGDRNEGEAAAKAKRVGRLSMIIQAMRPCGDADQTSTTNTDEPPTSSGGTNVLSKVAKPSDMAPVALRALSEQEEKKQTREKELKNLAVSEALNLDDWNGKLKYDAVFEKLKSEDPCEICQMYKRDTVFLCRVCGRPFHHGCLIGRGLGLDTNSSQAMENADTEVGWTCPDCETLSDLISMDEMSELMIKFDRYDTDGDSAITLPNIMEYEFAKHEEENNMSMPGSKMRECEDMFEEYDHDSDGVVTWGDYAMVESIKILQREPQSKLIGHLKLKEITKLRKYFRILDNSNIGMITVGESEQAYRSWLRALGLHETDEMMNSFERSSWSEECNKMITWERFLVNKALALITARPNTLTIKPYVTSREQTAS